METNAHPGTKLYAVFNGHFWDVCVSPNEFSHTVGSCHRSHPLGYDLDGAERYARLFAASPDLLDALRLVRESTEWSCMEAETQEAVDAAIAKAGSQ